MSTLVLYSYFERPDYRENLRFFLDHGMHREQDCEFVFVVNGETCTLELPEGDGVRVLKRDNVGLDFAGWNLALSQSELARHDHFIFINCTVRGPFLPVWARDLSWTECFTRLVDDDTKLVGTTINFHYGSPHLQSMLLCTDQVGLRIAYDRGIFGGALLSNKVAIGLQREIAFSHAVLAAGFGIRSLMAAYDAVDWRKPAGFELSANVAGGSALARGDYFGGSVHPHELLFVKGSPELGGEPLERLTAWHDGEAPRGPLADSPIPLAPIVAALHVARPAFVLIVGAPDASCLSFTAALCDLWHLPPEAPVIGVLPGDGVGGEAAHARVRIIRSAANGDGTLACGSCCRRASAWWCWAPTPAAPAS